MRFFSIVFSLVLLSILYLPYYSFAQIDITKYASDDLFEVQPVVSQEYIEQKSKEVEEFGSASHFDEFLQKGMDYWSRGDYDDAVYHFDQMAEEFGVPQLYYFNGMINYERERYEDAREYFEETLDKDPLFLEAKYMLGMVAIDKEDLKSAKDHFKQLEEVPAYEAYGLHGMAIHSLEQGNFYRAIVKLRKCIKTDPTFLEAYIPLVVMEVSSGDVKYARKIMDEAIEVNKEWQEGIMVRAILALLADEDVDQFEKDINTLINLSPDNYHYYSIKGYLDIELGKYSDAVSMFHKAYNLELDSTRTGEFKFSSRMKKEESIHRSLNYYFEHRTVPPKVRQYLDRGICEFMADNKTRALVYLDSANMIKPTPATHMFIGAVQRSMYGKNDQEIKAYSKSIELDSTNWMAYSYRAEAYLENQDMDSGYMDYNKVIELKPRAKEGYKNRGVIFLHHGHYRHAYKDFSVAIAIDPTDYDLFFNRAIVSMNLKAYKEAIQDLHQIIRNKPDDGEAHYILQQCLLNIGDTTMAIAHLDSASKYSKYKEEIHEELLEWGERLSRPDLCLAAHDRLVKYNSWNYTYLLNRAKYFYQTGDHEKALKDLEKYVKRKKKSGEGYYYLGVVLKKTGDEKKGDRFINRAKKYGFSLPD